MNQDQASTIAAAATAPGGALAVIRISGPRAFPLAAAAWGGPTPLLAQPPRRLVLGRVVDGAGRTLDQALAVRFLAAASYTGEPVVEFHCHGGAQVTRAVLGRLHELGAEPAGPGEFTRRAFLNGRLDLTQAEAVADIISAQSDQALRLAERQLAGQFRRRVEELDADLATILADIEACLDFPDDAPALPDPAEQLARLAGIRARVEGLLAHRREGEILRHGLRVVLAGPPNVGKSSLLNALLGRDRAIVTPLPGTTRDTLEESIAVQGVPLCLIDTAGLRAAADPLEEAGIARTRSSLAQAHLILWIVDAALPVEPDQAPPDLPAGTPVLRVANKADLLAGPQPPQPPGHEPVFTSAVTGQGLAELTARMLAVAWTSPPGPDDIAVAARHAHHLDRTLGALQELSGLLAGERYELVAVLLRGARQELGRITGKTHAPDILDTIFARFCIGK